MGVTACVSAPERLVQDVVGCFRAMGVEGFENFEATTEEMAFALPSISFQALAKNAGDATEHHRERLPQ